MVASLRLLANSAPDPLREPLRARLLPGRLVECSGPSEGASARLSTAVSLVRHVQALGEPVVWIQRRDGPLFPPDLQHAGLDLDALVVVHIAMSPLLTGLCKAAELLLRSGAFGLLVVDLEGEVTNNTAMSAWLGRMLGLARQHASRVLLLTEKSTHEDSLGTLIGLRIEPRRHRDSRGYFVVEHHVIKNKSGAPIDLATERCRLPDGIEA